jgi:hypothetical protein
LTTPYTPLTFEHVKHAIKSQRLRQPAWETLASWLADMRERTAWANVEFAIMGEKRLLARATR